MLDLIVTASCQSQGPRYSVANSPMPNLVIRFLKCIRNFLFGGCLYKPPLARGLNNCILSLVLLVRRFPLRTIVFTCSIFIIIGPKIKMPGHTYWLTESRSECTAVAKYQSQCTPPLVAMYHSLSTRVATRCQHGEAFTSGRLYTNRHRRLADGHGASYPC